VSVNVNTGEHFTGGTQVVVRLRDGETLRESIDLTVAETDLERQWSRLAAKFRGLASPLVGADQAERILALVARLDTLDSIDELVAAAVPARVGAPA
jgi:hypothetical protein